MAETHTNRDATKSRCDKSLRQIAATRRRDRFSCCNRSPRVTCENHCRWDRFCRFDLHHEFKLVWIRAIYRSDKIAQATLSQKQCRRGDLSPRFVASGVSALMNAYTAIVHVAVKLCSILTPWTGINRQIMNSQTSTKQTKARPNTKTGESAENISAMIQNQSIYNDVPIISSRKFRECRFGGPRIARVTSSEELGTITKNN